MKVKICGITDLDTAMYAAEAGADALGFVFAASKRKISPQKAKEIIDRLPEHVLKIGVFVNESKESIERHITEAGLTAVQLHGDEPPSFCADFSVPVVKAISIESADDVQKIDQYPCEYVLLDSPKGKYRGGNGIAFDWSILAGIEAKGKKIILAGGLTPGNVSEGIQLIDPFMVDVSSGVESDGKKDKQKITKFIAEAKRTERKGEKAR